MGQDLDQTSHLPGDGLSAIGEDLDLFAERACIDKQIDIWAKVVKDNGSQQMERWVQPLRERGLRAPFCFIGRRSSYCGWRFSLVGNHASQAGSSHHQWQLAMNIGFRYLFR